jgi:hypothetical protein
MWKLLARSTIRCQPCCLTILLPYGVGCRLYSSFKFTMEIPSTDIKLMAFYEIARRANLTNNPDLTKSPTFQKAKELYEARAAYMREAFGNQEAIYDYFKLRLEGLLAGQGKRWEDVWAEFAPELLKGFPLPPGSL